MLRAARLLNLRRIRHQPVRSLISVVAVGAGISLAIAVIVLTTSTSQSLTSFARTVAGPTALRVVGATSRGGLAASEVPVVRRTEGVGVAVPVVQAVTYAVDRNGNSVPIIAFGVDCSVQALVGPLGCSDQLLASATDTTPPLISDTLARRLGTGATVRTDIGTRSLDHGPAVAGLDRLNGGNVVIYPLQIAQKLFDRPARLDAIYVQPAKGVSVATLKSRLQDAVGGWNGVLGATDPPPGAGVVTATFVPLFTLLSFFVLGIAAVLVYNTMALSLEDRRRDLAVLGALGSPGRILVGGVMAEAGVLGLVGGLVGTVGGIALAHPLVASVSDFTKKFAGIPMTVHFTGPTIIIGIVLGGLLAALAALFPARRALKMDVAAELSMRDINQDAAPAARVVRIAIYSVVAGVGLLLCWAAQRRGGIDKWQAPGAQVGVLVLSVGVLLVTGAAASLVARVFRRASLSADGTTRLGVANVIRDPGRTAVMALSIGAAVSIGFVVASTRLSIHDAIERSVQQGASNLVSVSTLSPNNTINVDAKTSPDLIRRLAAIPGVAAVHRNAAVFTGHNASDLIGVAATEDQALTPHVVLGSKDRAGFDAGKVLIGVALARAKGLRPGDQLQLATPNGFRTVTIGGVWQNGDFTGRVVNMPYPLFTKLYPNEPVDVVDLVPAAGVTVDQLAARVRAANLDPDLVVDTPTQVVARASRDVSRQLSIFDAMQRALMIVVFIAILSTLLLVGAQRRRELGLLAAVGMEPRQLARMTLTEAATVGLAGSVLAVVGALIMNIGFILVIPIIIGYKDPLRFDFPSLLVWIPAVFVVVFAAAALPAWRTSRIQVLEALQYE